MYRNIKKTYSSNQVVGPFYCQFAEFMKADSRNSFAFQLVSYVYFPEGNQNPWNLTVDPTGTPAPIKMPNYFHLVKPICLESTEQDKTESSCLMAFDNLSLDMQLNVFQRFVVPFHSKHKQTLIRNMIPQSTKIDSTHCENIRSVSDILNIPLQNWQCRILFKLKQFFAIQGQRKI